MTSPLQFLHLSPGSFWSTTLAGLVFLVHLSGIALAIHALCREHSPQGTIAWMLGLILLPWITVPLYLVLGAARIRRHTSIRLLRESIQNFLCQHGAWDAPTSQISRTLTHCTGYSPCSGNDVHLLRDGNDTYRNLLQAIRNAQHSILLEFFIIRNDRVGIRLRKALEDRARAGVQVYVIYDEVGSHKLPAGYLRHLRRAGVRITSFNGKRFWLSSILRLNYRNHRKLVVIDSREAYLGSLNIGLEYTRSARRTYWRDTFVRLRGPVVSQCLVSFLDDWQRATGENISHLSTPCAPQGGTRCQLIPSGPDDIPVNTWRLTLLELAATAKERLWLASPYFVPDEAVQSALCGAALRGVDVRVLIPRRGDSIAAHLAMLTYIPGMIACGVHLLAYEPGFLHEKVCVKDADSSSIGTANLDERSMRLNFELTLLMEDTSATAGVAAMLEQDMAEASPITPDRWHKAALITRLMANCCRLLSPAL
ncbi:MAG: cardiolipin synthase [Akkermansia sp.]|nr:cardiolipin synthase [Akkermansia sp.]